MGLIITNTTGEFVSGKNQSSNIRSDALLGTAVIGKVISWFAYQKLHDYNPSVNVKCPRTEES